MKAKLQIVLAGESGGVREMSDARPRARLPGRVLHARPGQAPVVPAGESEGAREGAARSREGDLRSHGLWERHFLEGV